MAGAQSDRKPGEAAPVREAGLEAPPPPAADPNKKTDATSDPTADDPGNGAD
ncbi:hypothetical protein [Caulobacter sp. RL271]|uniref:Uncharacterized protein n=1 Tax=Caulobacter segnis TaxID=88688 RepID=A0ABY4ZRH3_9CAUL|nr:hypothetical protein [Caulobacter segnis]USQ95328.1 hypothetical protein MZV50_22700 [Caulobacter segnis]